MISKFYSRLWIHSRSRKDEKNLNTWSQIPQSRLRFMKGRWWQRRQKHNTVSFNMFEMMKARSSMKRCRRGNHHFTAVEDFITPCHQHQHILLTYYVGKIWWLFHGTLSVSLWVHAVFTIYHSSLRKLVSYWMRYKLLSVILIHVEFWSYSWYV